VPSHWSVIDVLVRDIGSLAVEVHLAEHTLATDPRTRAARRALDAATDAVCTAMDEVTADAEAKAQTEVERARTIIARVRPTARSRRSLAGAARDLIERPQGNGARSARLPTARPQPRRHGH
jgi:hypothetical protein